ncbi:phage minor capsid protein [Lactiplantibacillus plantarum]|uniref:phage minor capsid protein n=1 Tax=Lactiplantibacillus plantarum TaxID=1590 RepID=UPI002ADD94D8|nr:phage minor capsid protein [Lactiplantibacillus plantarum]MEA0993624.1 phage minor capsid protein [Lactiplantibacillus plantarum]MEA1033559.1 phage minor capsid protein [Lactiplantibacillus plantarum]
MLNPWDLDNIADGDAQNFANVESLIWSHMMDVLAAEQKQQPDDAKPSEWQQAMLDHANEVRQFAEQVTGKPQKDAMLTLQTKLGPMTYNNMKQAEAWLKAHTHNPVDDIKDSKQIAQIVEAGQVKGEKYINLARRNMSDNALTQFDKIVSTASLNMRNGMTNKEALSQAGKQWADQGVPALIDKAGRHWSPDVYVRTVIESAVNQTTNDTELTRYKQYGSLVRVDSHAGCRPSHLQFQDHIYSLTGDTEKYPDFESTTGYGTITGIGGINCRHHTLPYIEGEGYMKVPQMSADDNATLYANKQAQRRLESNVRKAKRQLEAAEKLGDPADIANAKQLVTRRQTAVREFVNDKGLTRRYYREKINVIKGSKFALSMA